MTAEFFSSIAGEQINRCLKTLEVKADEYTTHDRLHNFKTAAVLLGTTNKGALAGMLAKHIVSVFDMCYSRRRYSDEMWNEKIGDSINYLLLLRAIVEEDKINLPSEIKKEEK